MKRETVAKAAEVLVWFIIATTIIVLAMCAMGGS